MEWDSYITYQYVALGVKFVVLSGFLIGMYSIIRGIFKGGWFSDGEDG